MKRNLMIAASGDAQWARDLLIEADEELRLADVANAEGR